MKTKKTKMLAMTLVSFLLVCMGAMVSSCISKETKEETQEEEKPDYDLVALAEAVEKYDYVGGFSDGLAMVAVGEIDIIDEVEDGFILNGKLGFINKMGEEVIPLKYDWAKYFSDGLAAVENGGKYGFINEKGEEVVPCKYSEVWDFSEGMARVRMGDWSNSKYGFVNEKGEEVFPCKYDRAGDFSDGLALVRLGDKWGYVDKNGNDTFSVSREAKEKE